MSYFTSYWAWTRVTSGIRTRIWQGPLFHIAPVHWIVFGQPPAPDVPITFTVTVYTAAPPWYFTDSGSGTVWSIYSFLGGRSTGAPAWDKGFPILLLASPWVEVFVVTNRNCFAQLQVAG